MDVQKLLLELFDSDSGIYPLHIIPTGMSGYGIKVPNTPEFYSGIHFVDTASLLSIKEPYQELITAAFDDKGQIVEIEEGFIPVIHFESIEVGCWCKNLIRLGDALSLEHTDIPFLYKDDTFDEFERLAKASISRKTVLWGADQAQQNANTLMSPRVDNTIKVSNAFYAYYSVLQSIVLATTGRFIHEANALAEIQPDVATLYSDIMKRVSQGGLLSRRELSAAYFEVNSLLKLLVDADGVVELPEEPEEEVINAINNELLRLRRALL